MLEKMIYRYDDVISKPTDINGAQQVIDLKNVVHLYEIKTKMNN